MKLVSINETPAGSSKKLVAVICECKGKSVCADKDKKRIQFGSKGSTTYTSGATEQQKDAYLARHKVNEDWNSINAGSLSRYILWSSKTLAGGIANFRKKFHC